MSLLEAPASVPTSAAAAPSEADDWDAHTGSGFVAAASGADDEGVRSGRDEAAPLLPRYIYDPARPRASLLRLAASVGFVIVLTVVIVTQAAAIAASPPSSPTSPVSQVGVTLGKDPNTQLTVSWAVPLASGAVGVAASARVRYGLVGTGAAVGALTSTAAASCTFYSTTPAQTHNNSAYTSPILCSVSVAVPASPRGIAVSYVVGDDINGFSSVRTTSTAPPTGVAGVRFTFLGDLGTTDDSVATLGAIAASHAAAPFAAAFLLGDLSYADGVESVWDTYGALVDPLTSRLPLWTAPGNHEWFSTVAKPCNCVSGVLLGHTLRTVEAKCVGKNAARCFLLPTSHPPSHSPRHGPIAAV